MASTSYTDLVKNAAPAAGSEPIPVGKYESVVSGAEFKVSSNGNPMWNVEFTITEEGPAKNRKAWRNLTITEKSVSYVLRDLMTLGTSQDDVAAALQEGNDQGKAVVAAQLIDSPCVITIKHREYNGRTQNDVDRIEASTGGTADPLKIQTMTSAAPPPGSRPAAPF